MQIEHTYLQDFLIVLVSHRVEASEKINILQKTIQECLHEEMLGHKAPVKLASQKLFQLSGQAQQVQQQSSSGSPRHGTDDENEEIFEIQ